MEKIAIIARGSGYADDRSFDPFEVIAHPLPTRESRVLKGAGDRNAVCYGSHDIKLAVRKKGDADAGYFGDRESTFYILMHHGGGTRVVQVQGVYGDDGATVEALKSLPEVALYSILYGIYRAVDESITVTRRETATLWGQAAIDKRIKISRIKQGKRTVSLVTPPDPLAP